MRARPSPSIFFALLLGCGARTELDGALPDAAVVDVASEDGPAATSCVAGVVQIATTGTVPDTIALSGDWVYWHEQGGIIRVKKSGGAIETLHPASSTFWPDLAAFAVGGGSLFYGKDVSSVMMDEQTLYALPNPGFASSASHVYVWSRDILPSPLLTYAFDGTGGWNNQYITRKPVEMTFAPPEIVCIAEDPGVECGGQLLSGLSATDLVATNDDVWFTSNDLTNGARVMHIELPSLKTAPIDDTVGALAIAGDATALYFTDATNRRVRRIAGKTGPVSDIASVGPSFTPVDVVADDTCVYWTSSSVAPDGPGAVMAGPKK
jgi:hypothetical protein